MLERSGLKVKELERLLNLGKDYKIEKQEEKTENNKAIKVIYIVCKKKKEKCLNCGSYTSSIHDKLKPIELKYLKIVEYNVKIVITKISLMYASDYQLSLGSSALSCTGFSNYITLRTGWMHISNNDSGTPSSNEWIMSRYGGSSSSFLVWYVGSRGDVDASHVSNVSAVRPVFHLASDVEISGGTGTITDPYILN